MINAIGNYIGKLGSGINAATLANLFTARVTADGGTVENEACLTSRIQSLKNKGLWDAATFALLSNGVKANKIYSIKPESGSGDLAFARAATRTRQASSFIESVATGVPALDYTNDTCPAISVEPARTNLLLQSNSIDNASWTKVAGTPTANVIAGPDNLVTADRFLETATLNNHSLRQSFTKAASSLPYTISWYVKGGLGRDWIALEIIDSTFSNGAYRYFNIATGAVGGAFLTGAGFTHTAAKSTPVVGAPGWYRVELTVTTNTATNMWAILYTIEGGDSATRNFTGDVTKGVYTGGAQLEQAAYSTSYTPTTTATVLKAADTITTLSGVRTGGLTAGAFFVDTFLYSDTTTTRGVLKLSFDGFNFIGFELPSGVNQVRAIVTTANVQQMNIICGGNPIATGTRYKMLINFDTNNVQVYTNGNLNGSDVSVSIPTNVDKLEFSNFSGYINRLLLYERKLTSSQAISLTTS